MEQTADPTTTSPDSASPPKRKRTRGKDNLAKLNKPLANRIVGHGEERVDQLLANPLNFRLHPDYQQQALAGSIDEIGFIRSLTVNKRTGRVVDGHLRVTLAARSNVETLPVEYVDLDEDEEAMALASLDPIAALAETDKAKMQELYNMIQSDDERVKQMLLDIAEREGLANQGDQQYTHKIISPVYTPKGEQPAPGELFDETRTQTLLSEIQAADLPDDVRQFLIRAAARHTIFNYKKIAEFYAHASQDVQTLMENSGLVIIDFDRAIELGYVKLTEAVASQYGVDHGNAE